MDDNTILTAAEIWLNPGFSSTLKRWAHARWYNDANAEDVLQEGFLVFQRRVEFEPVTVSTDKVHLLRRAKNACIDAARGMGEGYWSAKKNSDDTVETMVIPSSQYYAEPAGYSDSRLVDWMSEVEDATTKVDLIKNFLSGGDDQELIAAIKLLIAGKSQREAAKEVGMSANKLNARLASLGKKLSGEKPVRRDLRLNNIKSAKGPVETETKRGAK